MTSLSSRCLPTMGAGVERGPTEDSERTRCGVSYLVVIGILPPHIAHHVASSLRGRLTWYSNQRSQISIQTINDDNGGILQSILCLPSLANSAACMQDLFTGTAR